MYHKSEQTIAHPSLIVVKRPEQIISQGDESVQICDEVGQDVANKYCSSIRKRLLARYDCGLPQHRICFITNQGVHVPLDDNDIETWVASCFKCETSIFDPPREIIPLDRSDTISSRSSRSRTNLSPKKFRLNCSLKDAQAIKENLQLRSTSDISSASSGIPGPGYLCGKMMEKVGERLLAGFIRLDITRRLFLIGRLARNIQRGSFAARSAYLTNNPNIVIRASEDLLELFDSKKYGKSLRKSAERLATSIISSTNGIPTTFNNATARLNLLPLELSIKRLPSSDIIIDGLRGLLLEERDENDDPEIACAEAMRYIISELLFASPTQSWRFYGYSTLWSLAETEAGLECMKSLEDRGGVATVFAQQYDCSPPCEDRARICALGFIVRVADRVPALQSYVAKSTGTHFVLARIDELVGLVNAPVKSRNIKMDDTKSLIRRWWRVLELIASYAWGAELLMQNDIAAFLRNGHHWSEDVYPSGRLLSSHSMDVARMSYSQLNVLRDITALGGIPGRDLVHGLVTESKNLLPRLVSRIKDGNLGGIFVQRTYEMVGEIEAGVKV